MTILTVGNGSGSPLRVSADGRYLTDHAGVPFLLIGDSPHMLFQSLSLADTETYLASRSAAGINAIWVHLLVADYVGSGEKQATYDSIAAFTSADDLSTPNESYFARMDAMIALCAQYGVVAMLDPLDLNGWMATLRTNGTTKAAAYGAWLGNRYKNVPNILWWNGNDFQTWNDATDRALVQAIANGIKSADSNHLHTVQLNYNDSDSLQDASWGSIISLNLAYSYYPEYVRMLTAYNRTVGGNPVPAFYGEGDYEYYPFGAGYQGPRDVRVVYWWVALSGACGQFTGNEHIYTFESGWDDAGWDTTAGFLHFAVFNAFMKTKQWWALVPDQAHAVLTAGYGTFDDSGTVLYANTSDYCTCARVPDGSLVLIYMPVAQTMTVDMTKLRGTVTCRWLDPTTGTFYTDAASPHTNTGSHQFSRADANSTGDHDWLLILEA